MFVRRRPLLRAAVVGGGAYVIGKKSGERAAAQSSDESSGQAPAQPQGQSPGQSSAQPAQPSGSAQPASQDAHVPPQVQAPPPAFDTDHGNAGAGEPAMTDQLTQLSRLHEQGALSDTEFARAKARLLGG